MSLLNGPQHIVGKILFQQFCELCEKIKNAKIKNKVDILRKYIEDFRSLGVKETTEMGKDFFPILRMLLPQAERDRGAYGIRETVLAKMYIRILNLPKQGLEASKLINYKAPSSSQATTADFADVAFYVLKARCHSSGLLSIVEVNNRLDKIATFHAENMPRNVDEELTKFISSMTALQQKWLIRIILKDLKLGMGQQKILSCFHVDAPDLFDSCNSLSKVCSTLHSPSVRLHEIDVEVFSPFRPMLSEKLDITKINKSLKKDEKYFIEMKFDGERFQIHMKDNKFKYFSRNGFDFTANFGETYDADGLLTRYLKEVLAPEARSFILDGEMMGWHKTKKIFGSKGMTFDVKKMTENSNYRPCFCAFDLLLLNDVVLTNVPLNQRLDRLDNLFSNKEGFIIHSKRVETQSSEEVLGALNKAIDDQDEGIVLKNIMSLYKPNSRKSGWFKIKPEYTDGAMNELDLLIIGGYYTENKRHGLVNSVMLGVAVPPELEGGTPLVFHAVGKVMLSLRAEESEELCRKLQPHWRTLDKGATPPEFLCWARDKPDLWIEPKNSYILQIKASELIRSSAFKTEYTLRFPRIEKIRFDKPWCDCMTTAEFAELTRNSHNVEKLTARRIEENEMDDGADVSPKKRSRTVEVSSMFKSTDLSGVQETSSLYCGKEICVVTGNGKVSKAELEIKIVENGGKIVQNPGSLTYCIVAGIINARVTNIIKAGSHNVATVEWLLHSVQPQFVSRGTLPEWTPQDLIGTSKKVAEEFALKYDQFGDSFTQPATLDSLKYSMKRVHEIIGKVHLLPVEFLEMDKELFPDGISPYSFLRSCHFYFMEDYSSLTPKERVIAERKIRIIKIEVEFFGGRSSCELIDDGITHILVPSFCDRVELVKILKAVEVFTIKPLIVSLEWLEMCLLNRKPMKADDFIFVL